MTLIAAFRCANGVVLGADSQETAGSFRVTVDKLLPKTAGEYGLVVGGAGNHAGLIDGFVDAFVLSVTNWPGGLSEAEIKLKIRDYLLTYHRNEVKCDPATADDKRLQFIFCIKPQQSRNVFLWESDGTGLLAVGDYALIGFNDMIYKHEARKLYSPGMSFSQTVLLAINLFSLAKNTCNYIGGPTKIVTCSANRGIQLHHPSEIADIEVSTQHFNKALDALVLACPNLELSSQDFDVILKTFQTRATELREDYLKKYLVAMMKRNLTEPNDAELAMAYSAIAFDEVEIPEEDGEVFEQLRIEREKAVYGEEKWLAWQEWQKNELPKLLAAEGVSQAALSERPLFYADTDDYEDWIQMHKALVGAAIRRHKLKAHSCEDNQQGSSPAAVNSTEQIGKSRHVIRQSAVQKLEDE